tara:strand:+ start:451 stop:1455 length:1005 start_codon:yes stop_codon:yes gene_type:complete
MAVTTFKYCDITDVQQVFSNIAQFDSKFTIYNWKTTDTTNQYQAFNTGYIDQLYFDGIEGTAVTDSPNADYEYNYSESTDSVQVFLSTANPNDLSIEAGVDFTTFITDQIEASSQQLNSMLDHSRFPIPLPKAYIYSSDPANDSPEYDYIVKRLTALITAYNVITSRFPQSEEAVALYAQVTNEEETGLLDKLNAGKITLAFETDSKDSDGGRVIEVTKTGSMSLVETYGEFRGARYDRIQCICTTGGAYGAAKITIKTYDGTNLYGAEQTGEVITGGLQHISGGIYARFEGASMAVSDRFDIEVRGMNQRTSNTAVKSVRVTRGARLGRRYKL